MKGTVKWFSKDKGYGFITSDSGIDNYVHVTGIVGSSLPNIGDQVEFESVVESKGPVAKNVIITQAAESNPHDRIECPGCQRMVVPRLKMAYNRPEKSFCPFCATTIKSFQDCFIATAVYRDPCCSEVRALRKFRDNTLRTWKLGRWFIKIYYKNSPAIADKLKNMPNISKLIKAGLNCLVKVI